MLPEWTMTYTNGSPHPDGRRCIRRLSAASTLLLGAAACTSPAETFEALEIVTQELPMVRPNVSYSEPLVAEGGDGSYAWSLSGGSLPSGLAVDVSGRITGTTSESGTWFFTASVESGDAQVASHPLTLESSDGPVLLTPETGAILDNGCSFDRTNKIIWDFDWEDVEGATSYHLVVIGPSAIHPVIDDASVTESRYRWSQAGGYIIESNRRGWTWSVRANGGTSTGWSVERLFHVEPNNQDCP
jgi:hypothetical protein